MIYEYRCEACDKSFDVVKSYKDLDNIEKCSCGLEAKRIFFPRKLHLHKTKVTHAEYNPAFGKVINNKRELDYEVKKHNLIEVGNEAPEKIFQKEDKERKEKAEKNYEDLVKNAESLF